jgi:hypothetical protein
MRQTLHRQSLKGIKGVAIKVTLLADGCDGSFFPVSKTSLVKSIGEALSLGQINVDARSSSQLHIDVRARLLNLSETPAVMVKIETFLREPVTIARNGLATQVDTWRHRLIAAAFSGIPDPTIARELIEAEVLRQVEAFATEASLASPADDRDIADPPTHDDRPPNGHDRPGRSCHRVHLGSVEGEVEVKTEMERQCVGPPWARICSDVPVLYSRVKKISAYAEVCGPKELLESVKKDIEACATMAAGAVTIAVILAGPEAALPAFKETFLPCIEAKLQSRAAELSVDLKVESESGEWRRRS